MSGWHVSSAPVVQQTGLTDRLQQMQKIRQSEKPKTVTTFSEKEHEHGNPVGSFQYARVDKLMRYITTRK